MNNSDNVQRENARKRALNVIWEYNNTLGIREDNDGFTIDLASAFVELKSNGGPLSMQRWQAATSERQTSFYKLNKLKRKHYLTNLFHKLNSLDISITKYAFEDILRDFKHHVERQQRSMFRLNLSKQEEIGRGLLLAYLPLRGYREVPTGTGRIDLACFERNQVKYVVETKIWRSHQHYLDGLDELIEYLETEQLDLGHYVIFVEKLKQSGPAKNIPSQDYFCESKEGKKIFVVIVDISIIPPSRKGRIKRKTLGGRIENDERRD